MHEVAIQVGVFFFNIVLNLFAKVSNDEDECMIYHFALENENVYANYGVLANGLLVETCSIRYLKELSNMDLLVL